MAKRPSTKLAAKARPRPAAALKPKPKPAPKTRQGPPPELLMQVGARIRAVRQARGLGQDALAYGIGLDRAHIGYIENGKRAATIPTLVRIAWGLGCEVGDLFPPMAELERSLPET